MRRGLTAICLTFLLSFSSLAGGIVSLLPSVTDMVVDLGAANRLSGITRYGIVPEGTDVVRLGGMYDLNVEAVIRLNPDVVLAYHGAESRLKSVVDTGIPVIFLRINTLDNVLEGYVQVGRVVGKEQLAKARVDRLRQMLSPVKSSNGKRPAVLIVTGPGGLTEARIFVSANSFYGNLLPEIGAKNAVSSKVAYPSLSREGLLEINPDIVVLLSEKKVEPLSCGVEPFSFLKACRNRAVFNIYGPRMMHPGPVVFQLVPILKRILAAYAGHSTALLPKYFKLD